MHWFDAHLDLAYLEASGRDMNADPAVAGGPDLPAAITLPSLRDGNVRACLATIFTETGGTDARISYPPGDADAAAKVGLRQVEIYERWRAEGCVEFMGRRGTTFAKPKVVALPRLPPLPPLPPLLVGLLVEGADPISGPDELASWVSRGVISVGLAWAKQTRYAGGNMTESGLTDLGRAMVKEMDRLNVVHDASHLSDRALAELLDLTERPVIASHSNCRAIIDGAGGGGGGPTQRHLTDDAIREIARRGGVIGINLYSKFLMPGAKADRRATLAEFAAHVERICEIAGDRTHVGLGSDMDGGFSAATLPVGVERPRDLARLAEELSRRGWSDADVNGFAWGNWAGFWGIETGEAGLV